MSSAGKKIVDSLTFLLFKEKKCFLPPQYHHLHQFFSLFKKWKKRKNKTYYSRRCTSFPKKQKQKLIEQKHPKIYISMQTKSS